MRTSVFLMLGFGVALSGCANTPRISDTPPLVTYTEQREVCADRSATRNPYFGDLHIHTAFSYDARPFGTEITPAEAYLFAQGEPIGAPPYDQDGDPTQIVQLKRPLDFAAVTDHSEFFGEVSFCNDPTNPAYGFRICEIVRGQAGNVLSPLIRILLTPQPERDAALCGEGGALCEAAADGPWRATQEMAEAAYDRSSDCSFTTFVAYEHTGTPNSNNYHRNVIFRNAAVPDRAISYIETPSDRLLWESLTEECLEGLEDCDVLAIPHNSNISSGAMFPSLVTRTGSMAEAAMLAQTRNALEPVMEVFQHKGNSECFNGFPDILGAPDELCNVEQFRTLGERTDIRGTVYDVQVCEDGEVGRRGFVGFGCVSKNDFYRSVLLTGLQDEAVTGVNSYKFGVIASTDAHTGLAGAVDEHSWPGHLVAEATLEGRLQEIPASPRQITANPGGLAGVWAVENSRDAIFEALRRREVFGTTGPRMTPRFFAGWGLSEAACSMADKVEHGYEAGVPMGSDLAPGTSAAIPSFLAFAEQDPDGDRLQRLQIIKGWVDADGQSNYRVIDVAGQDNVEGRLDLQTGKWGGSGASELCTVFQDDQFDPDQAAYYYLRVVQVPTLRWSWSQCVALPEEERPAACTNDAPKSTQELAWTSPIWYLPTD